MTSPVLRLNSASKEDNDKNTSTVRVFLLCGHRKHLRDELEQIFHSLRNGQTHRDNPKPCEQPFPERMKLCGPTAY